MEEPAAMTLLREINPKRGPKTINTEQLVCFIRSDQWFASSGRIRKFTDRTPQINCISAHENLLWITLDSLELMLSADNIVIDYSGRIDIWTRGITYFYRNNQIMMAMKPTISWQQRKSIEGGGLHPYPIPYKVIAIRCQNLSEALFHERQERRARKKES